MEAGEPDNGAVGTPGARRGMQLGRVQTVRVQHRRARSGCGNRRRGRLPDR